MMTQFMRDGERRFVQPHEIFDAEKEAGVCDHTNTGIEDVENYYVRVCYDCGVYAAIK